ncbi:uncharacterized protein [Amphiura filiformis]|uniref:uncharacterized protein n=1 Tax=Amphiura filiformis TaxID=82378 RepID=UPI003B22310B
MVICKSTQWSFKHYLLFILDATYNAAVVTPISISLWWSVWDLFYALSTVISAKTYPHIGLWVLLTCGSIGKLSLYLLQYSFRHYVNLAQRSKLFVVIVTRIDLYITFCFGMAVWVGVWTLMDEITGINTPSTMVCLAISLPGLFILRSLRNGVSAPMNLDLDSNQKPFDYPMRFKVDPSNDNSTISQYVYYFFDCFITVTVIDILLVFYWRAGFNILDLYILPNDPTLSAWITVIVGYAMFICVLFLQFPALNISKKLASPWQRLLYKSGYWILTFIMMVCIWRGIWNLIVIYAGVEHLPMPYYYLVPLIAHICIVSIMFALNIFCNGLSGFTKVDDNCLNGSDLLVKKHLSNCFESDDSICYR